MTPRYIAAQTAGITKDYTWHAAGNEGADRHILLKRLVDDTAPSVAVCRQGDKWDCLIGGIRSSSTDFRGRNNRVNVVFCGLQRDEARSLALAALRDWDVCVSELLRAFDWQNPKSDKGWDVDISALEASTKKLAMQATVSPDGVPFSGRIESKNTVENWGSLATAIQAHPFSESDGIKLVVTGAPSDDAYKQMREQADMVLWTGSAADRIDLDEVKKKRESQNSLPSTKSRQPSEPPAVRPKTSSNELADSMPSKNALLIVCAVVGALVLVAMIKECTKKKDDESRPQIETPSQPPAPETVGKPDGTKID